MTKVSQLIDHNILTYGYCPAFLLGQFTSHDRATSVKSERLQHPALNDKVWQESHWGDFNYKSNIIAGL